MNMMKLLPAIALAAGLLPAAAGSAQAAVRTGTLTCDIEGGVGWVLGSSKGLSCRYTAFNGATELYSGVVRKFGVDIGVTRAGRVVWAVFEPAVGHGSLAGNYVGVSAEATPGAGVGANVLVGGGNKGITLQPLSLQGQTGFNVAAGIGSMSITPVAAAEMVQPGPRAHRVHRSHRYSKSAHRHAVKHKHSAKHRHSVKHKHPVKHKHHKAH